jgi:hypothetical protein
MGSLRLSTLVLTLVGNSLAADGPRLPNLTIGRCLQDSATIKLSGPAPQPGFEITITSDDPSQLLFASDINLPGKSAITLTVKPGMFETPEFWAHALGDSGTVEYIAKGDGFGEHRASVTLTPSAILMFGPYRAPVFRTTPRAFPAKLTLFAVRLDPSLTIVEEQLIAGGMKAVVEIESSEPGVGTIASSPVVISGGMPSAVTEFQPAGLGTTTVSASVPPGFTRPAEHSEISVIVQTPKLSLSKEMVVGKDLQVRAIVGLGEVAPPGGVAIEITCADPSKVVLSSSPTEVGGQRLSVTIPEGGVNAPVYLQALQETGSVNYTATAPGYETRTETIELAPSGVVVMARSFGPPDEGALVDPDPSKSPTGAVYVSLSKKANIDLNVWTVQLDPKTFRSADVTVQPLRAGAPLAIDLEVDNPEVGSVQGPITIEPGTDFAPTIFSPASPGSAVVSVKTPKGFKKSSNSTSLKVVVRQ